MSEKQTPPAKGDGKADAGKPKSDKAKAAAPRKAHPPRRGGGLALLALLVAAAVGGGLYYLWTLQQQQRVQLTSLQASGQAQASELQQLSRAQQGLDNRLGTLESKAETLVQQQQNLRGLMKTLRGRLGQNRRDWSLAEAEYLLTIANRRLQLARDVDGALAALHDADRLLERRGDPALLPVRRLIAREEEALKGVKQPDIDGLSMRIAALAGEVAQLPMPAMHRKRPAPEGGAAQKPQGATHGKDWRAVLNAVWHQLRGLVVIRRSGKAANAITTPEERHFLRQALRLKLETARLALLEHNDATYRNTLQEAASELKQHFDTGAPTVQSAIAALQGLAGEAIAPPLPDISASLRKLREVSVHLLLAPQEAAKRPAEPASGHDHKTAPAAKGSGR